MEAYEAVLSLLKNLTEKELDEVFDLVGSFILCREKDKQLISLMAISCVRHRFFGNISDEKLASFLEL